MSTRLQSEIPVIPTDAPIYREWADLSASETVLLGDLQEQNSEGYGRFILLVGLDVSESGPHLEGRGNIFQWLQQFTLSEYSTPVRLVLVQMGDQRFDNLFVWKEEWSRVELFFRPWTSGTVWSKRGYRGLSSARLEKVLRTL